jgi:hypothetical protein
MALRMVAGVPLFALLGIFTVSIAWVVVLSLAIYRSRLGKRCWHCGLEKVRESSTRSWLDLIARGSLLFPYRCSGCLRRFYRLRTTLD